LQAATNCVSAVDAQGGKVYYAIVRDGKSDKIDMCSNDELVHFAKKHHLEVASDYQHVDIFKNLLTHLNNFKKTSIEELTPVYIKPPVS
jgi:tRNA A37 threonylcarbamoyladenosine modification protein TsaB